MRVHIISDMEGVAGIVNGSQTNVVMDHHGGGGGFSFNSLVPELLDTGCEYVVPLAERAPSCALGNLEGAAPYDPGRPCEIKVEYTNTIDPQKLRHRAGVEILDPRTIVSRADDFWSAWRQFFF